MYVCSIGWWLNTSIYPSLWWVRAYWKKSLLGWKKVALWRTLLFVYGRGQSLPDTRTIHGQSVIQTACTCTCVETVSWVSMISIIRFAMLGQVKIYTLIIEHFSRKERRACRHVEIHLDSVRIHSQSQTVQQPRGPFWQKYACSRGTQVYRRSGVSKGRWRAHI